MYLYVNLILGINEKNEKDLLPNESQFLFLKCHKVLFSVFFLKAQKIFYSFARTESHKNFKILY